MRIKSIVSAAAMMSLAAIPVMASANPATSPSLSNVAGARASSSGKAHKSNLLGAGIVPIILGLAIIGGGIYIAVDDNNNDRPDSP
jgi:hypothetical protein